MLGKAKALAVRLGAWVLVAGVLGTLAGSGGAAERSELLGHWLSEKGKLIVEFYDCQGEVCGRIAWLKNTHRDGRLRRDTKNPDPALRDRPWCGIQVMRGLKRDGDDSWDGGHVYDPKRGKTYNLQATLKDDDRLQLRAYIGFKFLGKTETWTRPDPDQEIGCVTEG